MHAKVDLHRSDGFISNSSPLLVTPGLSQPKILLRTSNFSLQTGALAQDQEEPVSKSVRMKPLTKKMHQMSTPITGDFVVKKNTQPRPSADEKYAALTRLNVKQNKTSKKKKNNSTEDALGVAPISFSETFGFLKQPNNTTRYKVTPLAINAHAPIYRLDQENQTGSEPNAQKAQDKYAHFKKTISSFWPKSTLASNLGLATHQRCNSVAHMTQPASREPSEASHSHRPEPEAIETRIVMTKHKYLSSSRVAIADCVRVKTTIPSPKAGQKTEKKQDKETAPMEALNVPKVPSMNKTDSMFHNSKPIKLNESKFSNDEDISLRNDSFRYKDNGLYSLSNNELLIKNTPMHRMQPRHIKEEDSFPHDSMSSAKGHFLDSPLQTPHGSYSNLMTVNSTPIGPKMMKQKLKDTINPAFDLDGQYQKKSGFKMISTNQLKSASFSEKPMLFQSKTLESGELNRKGVKRLGTISLAFDKKTKLLAEKSSPSHRVDQLQDLANIDNFEIEGWGQETDGF